RVGVSPARSGPHSTVACAKAQPGQRTDQRRCRSARADPRNALPASSQDSEELAPLLPPGEGVGDEGRAATTRGGCNSGHASNRLMKKSRPRARDRLAAISSPPAPSPQAERGSQKTASKRLFVLLPLHEVEGDGGRKLRRRRHRFAHS